MSDRPLETRQLDALKDWLEATRWEVHEAACILAGVLPPERRDDKRDFGAWLPGREAWEHLREEWQSNVMSDIAHIEAMLREAKAAHGQSPKEYLELGANLGFTPPWLDVAVGDPECLNLLPSGVSDTPAKERPIQIANRKKSLKRWGEDDKRILMNGAGRAEFEKLHENGFAGHTHKGGEVNFASVARALLKAIAEIAPGEPDCLLGPRTAERRVKEWVKSKQSDSAPALSDNASAHMAK